MKLGFSLFLFASLIIPSICIAQPYELTQTDILALKKIPPSSEVSVLGISLNMRLEEVLRKFNRAIKDVKKEDNQYILDLTPDGVKVLSEDKVLIHSIVILKNIKNQIKGELSKYFELSSPEEFHEFVKKKVGTPDYESEKYTQSFHYEIFFYLDGYVFKRLSTNNTLEFSIEICPKDYVSIMAKNNEAVEGKQDKMPDEEKPAKAMGAEDMPKPEASSEGFRTAIWGMTMEAVKKIEGKEPDNKRKSDTGLDMMVYKGKAGSLDCLYVYYFAENNLVQGRYNFVNTHINKNNYIDDFNTVKNSLIEKYGHPTVDHMVWLNDLYKDDPSDWGMAVSAGHLGYEAIWSLNNTRIQLQLTGDNFALRHQVQYSSTAKEHIDLMKKAEEKAQKGIW